MDKKFSKKLEADYKDWERIHAAQKVPFHWAGTDVIKLDGMHSVNDAWLGIGEPNDAVNSPSHYTRGSQEAIDIIEESIQDAPDPVLGMLQAQALKYLLRLWLKENSKQDAEKARWYLNRLIEKLD